VKFPLTETKDYELVSSSAPSGETFLRLKSNDHLTAAEGTKFLTLEGLPSDHYLRVTGAGEKLLRGELPMTETLPEVGR
jgi:hypothetical protein